MLRRRLPWYWDQFHKPSQRISTSKHIGNNTITPPCPEVTHFATAVILMTAKSWEAAETNSAGPEGEAPDSFISEAHGSSVEGDPHPCTVFSRLVQDSIELAEACDGL